MEDEGNLDAATLNWVAARFSIWGSMGRISADDMMSGMRAFEEKAHLDAKSSRRLESAVLKWTAGTENDEWD